MQLTGDAGEWHQAANEREGIVRSRSVRLDGVDEGEVDVVDTVPEINDQVTGGRGDRDVEALRASRFALARQLRRNPSIGHGCAPHQFAASRCLRIPCIRP